MSDTLSRIKLQLRPVNGSVLNGNGGNASGDDKAPSSPATKLLINHGKPNYTIQRSPKAQQNGGTNPLNNELQNNNRNNYYPYKSAGVKGTTGIITNGNISKVYGSTNNNNNISSSSNSSQNGDEIIVQSTKFNGVFKPANIQQVENKDEVDNQVVLRHVPKPEAVVAPQNGNEGNVPEFILRQRRIQERLAKENVLDFENRRSGYFTHVVISPTSPNRTSLVETMSSPPIVPSLEIPPPAKEVREASIVEESSVEVSAANGELETPEQAAAVETRRHVEEEEVAKAIEEVNKAVAGEVDDEKVDAAEDEASIESEKVAEVARDEQLEEHTIAAEKEEEHKADETKVEEAHTPVVSVVVTSAPLAEAEVAHVVEKETAAAEQITEPTAEHVSKPEAAIAQVEVSETAAEPPKPVERQQPAADEQAKHNGHDAAEEVPTTNGDTDETVTISHTNGVVANGISNGHAAPSLPTPDPSGALGVNYEPKTVVSFSKDLGEPNKYPDTVKVVKTAEDKAVDAASDELKELAKLKFDIKADDKDVQVTPVLRTE
ncbi:PREDICTED: general transcriptional corepressor trfA [Rhagoletis zephyria]|uniref:general transcriptional corepressor trfA n=1 Tax=Rhagoletis zephyria TaxID=28612 RepID=UPI0008117B0F|nr:PREDICTED: general transcriptional corepressor trfA [Rhagoletis zephyria]XP_017476440.1 PREDICTED: general transcriptional corepressor trfA [Rhagoletis zephyria]XP_017476514.1 PREDICTED: general transcriptional corepressor trfA [Rhagoletis zephyria]XP_017476575.1 PREDICTED: general transcriptional corepressor trfA [Rhagoletis zephyria]XP_017476640.1 PREDICTED: general transcriptional corepressor trfA [Rhagoletis zephyria]XP_017476701.1 PREDICTED: general transcriptional corepressor trfA [Rh